MFAASHSMYHPVSSVPDYDSLMDGQSQSVAPPANRYSAIASANHAASAAAAAAAVSGSSFPAVVKSEAQALFDQFDPALIAASAFDPIITGAYLDGTATSYLPAPLHFPSQAAKSAESQQLASSTSIGSFNPLAFNYTPASSPIANAAGAGFGTPQNGFASPPPNAYAQYYQPQQPQALVPPPVALPNLNEFNPLPLSVDYLLGAANAQSADEFSPYSSPASYAMDPVSPVPISLGAAAAAAVAAPAPVAKASARSVPVRARAAAAPVPSVRPAGMRAAAAKATETLHKLSIAKSDDDDSDESDESPKENKKSNGSRKRKTEDDDSEFEAGTASGAEDSSIGTAGDSEIDSDSKDESFHPHATAATYRNPKAVKRTKLNNTKRAPAYSPATAALAAASAAAGGSPVVAPVPLPVSGTEITAPFIRAQLVSQVKALQQRINSGHATDPRTELESLKDVLGEYQFSSCSGTMAIYGLSFPHAASAIPAPKIAPKAAAVPSLPPPPPIGLYNLPPIQFNESNGFAFPAFNTASASSAPAAASAEDANSDLELYTFELLRTTHGSQMVFIQCQIDSSETIRFQLKINKHLISRAPTSAYFEGKSFVVPSVVPESTHQIRVSQVHRGATQSILCVVGGEVRHAKLKSKAELAKMSAAAAAAAAVDDDDDDEDADEKKPKRRTGAGAAAASSKKDKDSNNGRPLKCNIIAQAGIPIRFQVYGRRGTVPTMWASTKLRKLSDSRLIATNDDFKFKLIKS